MCSFLTALKRVCWRIRQGTAVCRYTCIFFLSMCVLQGLCKGLCFMYVCVRIMWAGKRGNRRYSVPIPTRFGEFKVILSCFANHQSIHFQSKSCLITQQSLILISSSLLFLGYSSILLLTFWTAAVCLICPTRPMWCFLIKCVVDISEHTHYPCLNRWASHNNVLNSHSFINSKGPRDVQLYSLHAY